MIVIAMVAGFGQPAAFAQSCAAHPYCTQMRSCAEADFYFRECGDSARDGDHDGIPCEELCGDTMETYLLRREAGDGGTFELGTPAVACGSKRNCTQMASCAEARAYLTQCGVRSLDGDGDGIPCDRLCRR